MGQARGDRQRARNPEHDREEIHELPCELAPTRHADSDRESIRAVASEPLGGLDRGKPAGRRTGADHSIYCRSCFVLDGTRTFSRVPARTFVGTDAVGAKDLCIDLLPSRLGAGP